MRNKWLAIGGIVVVIVVTAILAAWRISYLRGMAEFHERARERYITKVTESQRISRADVLALAEQQRGNAPKTLLEGRININEDVLLMLHHHEMAARYKEARPWTLVHDDNAAATDVECAPIPPELLAPTQGEILKRGVYEFRWSDAHGAERYSIYVAHSESKNEPAVKEETKDTFFVVDTTKFALDKGWIWKVKSLGNGKESGWSKIGTFDIEPR